MKALEWSRLKEFAEDEPNGTAAAAVKYILLLEADLARLRALEEEQRALTERVQHLLTTIDVERTGRKEAEEEVARLRGALERAALNVWVMRALPQFNNAEALEVLEQDLALHAQDTEVGR